MMFVDIKDPVYSTLNIHVVLGGSGRKLPAKTTITNGFYSSLPTTYTKFSALVGAINVAVTPLTTNLLTTESSPITLYPNFNNTSASDITFQGASITLDAQGDSNAQFFITAGTQITFNNIPSINLINGATNCNVFWVAGSYITFTGTSPPNIPGIFIAGRSITFENASQFHEEFMIKPEMLCYYEHYQ
jgi:hypothetical protein